jgi:hypothetical protein
MLLIRHFVISHRPGETTENSTSASFPSRIWKFIAGNALTAVGLDADDKWKTKMGSRLDRGQQAQPLTKEWYILILAFNYLEKNHCILKIEHLSRSFTAMMDTVDH